MATSGTHSQNDILFQCNSCKILLKQGNLLDENDVQFIVIPAPPSNESEPGTFAIYNEFKKKVDDNLKKEAEKIRRGLQPQQAQKLMKNNSGYIFVLLPYLKNPKVAHDLVKKNYTSCLKLAADNDARSVAFPTIGCGNRGFKPAEVAGLAFSSFHEFLETKNGKKLDEIRIVIYSSDVWTVFTETFVNLALEKKSKIKFVEFVSKSSIATETSHQPSHHENNEQYPDDFENNDSTRESRGEKAISSLNPDVPAFQPKSSTMTRHPRRYYINTNKTELHIIQGDITQTKVDAIVNAANERMLGGSGVDGVIHTAAGNDFYNACQRHKEIYPDVRLPTGRSRILLSYKMQRTSYYIINTAGPIYDNSEQAQCKTDLASCYKTSLELANLYDLETIAFTAISCGIFGYPLDEGAEVALQTVESQAREMKSIIFVLKDDSVYDAWVRKAKELGFKSMDKIDDEPAVKSKESTSVSEEKSTRETQLEDQDTSKLDDVTHSNGQSPSKNKESVDTKENKSNKSEKSVEKDIKHENDQTAASSSSKPLSTTDPDKKSTKSVLNPVFGRGRARALDPHNKS